MTEEKKCGKPSETCTHDFQLRRDIYICGNYGVMDMKCCLCGVLRRFSWLLDEVK